MNKQLYLDANAHLPINPIALKKYSEFSNSCAGHGHPSSLVTTGKLAAGALEESRKKIAYLIGAENPSQIIFTSGCTQACQWGLEIFKNRFFNFNEFEEYSCFYWNPIEHPAVSENLENNNSFKKIPINQDGYLSDITREHDFIVCTGLHNELGTIYPIKNIKRKHIFTDLSQSLGKIPVNMRDLDVDIAVFGAHKFAGPGGIGFMYLKDPSWWQPFEKGSRYFMDRPGTMDVASIVATCTALEQALESRESRTRNMINFRNKLEPGLEKFGFEIIGKNQERCPNTTFIYAPGKAIQILLELDKQGIYIGLGSACGSFHTGTSRTINELGRTGTNHDYLRISGWGEYDARDAEYILARIERVVK